MIKKFLITCTFVLFANSAQSAIIYDFDLSPADIFTTGDTLSISFADDTDFTLIEGVDLLSWEWDLGGVVNSSSNLYSSSLDTLFNFTSSVLTLTVGQTLDFDYAYIHSNLDFASQVGQGSATSLHTYGGSQHISPGSLTFIGTHANVPEPTSLALLGLGLAGILFSRKKKIS